MATNEDNKEAQSNGFSRGYHELSSNPFTAMMEMFERIEQSRAKTNKLLYSVLEQQTSQTSCNEDLPTFPVQENILNAVKERVKLARDLDKLDLQVRKANSEMGWIEKAAEEMDIIIDDNMSTKYNVKEARSFKKVAEVKRKQLTQLLANAIFPKGFSYKYPLLAEESNTPLDPVQKASQKAIEVLKQSMENNSKNIRKKAKWLFKPQKKFNIQTKTNVKVVGIKGKKQKKRKP